MRLATYTRFALQHFSRTTNRVPHLHDSSIVVKVGSTRPHSLTTFGYTLPKTAFTTLLLSAVTCIAQTPAPLTTHDLAQRIDRHYNHLQTLRAAYVERYSGMGQTREEHGSLLLKKPGRMRWTYTGGKLFVLDGKYAISYTPGDPQAQRIPAKQLDDFRSPLRFLLGHTEIEKELDHLTATPSPEGITLSGAPHYGITAGEQRIQTLSITADPATGTIRALRIVEIDGSTTEFHFSALEENVPALDTDFRFTPPPGVTVVDGLPPA